MSSEAHTFKPLPVSRHRPQQMRKIARGGDLHAGTYWARWEVQADSAEDAEQRLLSHLMHAYTDDFRGATAKAHAVGPGGFYSVKLEVPAPRERRRH